jgi:glycogen debranching enzyme
MDAKVGGHAITPRQGMPVEIQALWHNALRIMGDLAGRLRDEEAERRYRELADRAQTSFNAIFWNEQTGGLFDVIDGGNRDGSVRPNQIFALSLTHPLVTGERAGHILEIVERELLTPRGLRSLSPSDRSYRPRYEGGVWERDSAYHQGTVWSWLLGPHITAYVRCNERSETARARAAEWLRAFEPHLDEACIGQISEIFDGAEPHLPRGCAAQAWSVGEILRAAVEDVFGSTFTTRQELPHLGR